MLQSTYLYIITPNEGINESEFEIFINEEVFPEVQVLQRNVRGTSHRLFKGKTDDGQLQYLWMMQLDLVASGSATSGVDVTSAVLSEKIKDSASVSPRFTQT